MHFFTFRSVFPPQIILPLRLMQWKNRPLVFYVVLYCVCFYTYCIISRIFYVFLCVMHAIDMLVIKGNLLTYFLSLSLSLYASYQFIVTLLVQILQCHIINLSSHCCLFILRSTCS